MNSGSPAGPSPRPCPQPLPLRFLLTAGSGALRWGGNKAAAAFAALAAAVAAAAATFKLSSSSSGAQAGAAQACPALAGAALAALAAAALASSSLAAVALSFSVCARPRAQRSSLATGARPGPAVSRKASRQACRAGSKDGGLARAARCSAVMSSPMVRRCRRKMCATTCRGGQLRRGAGELRRGSRRDASRPPTTR